MRSIFLASLLLLGVAWTSPHEAAAAVTGDSALTLTLTRLPEDAVARGPVFVEFAITNETLETVEVNLGPGRKSAITLLISKDGGLAKPFPSPVIQGLSRVGWVKIAGKQRYTSTLLVNEWIELQEAGTYGLEAVVAMQIRRNSSPMPLQAKSNSVVIVLAAYDITRLDAICQRLRDRALTGNDTEIRLLAALGLGSVTDPVAVPYLEQLLLQGRFGKQYAAEGLLKIRSAAAVSALIWGLRDPQGDTADLSRSALLRVQGTDASSEVKALATAALHAK